MAAWLRYSTQCGDPRNLSRERFPIGTRIPGASSAVGEGIIGDGITTSATGAGP